MLVRLKITAGLFFDEIGSIANPVGSAAVLSSTAVKSSYNEYFTYIISSIFLFYYGEFDPGSGRTLAAGLTHASRTRTDLRVLVKWRTGE